MVDDRPILITFQPDEAPWWIKALILAGMAAALGLVAYGYHLYLETF